MRVLSLILPVTLIYAGHIHAQAPAFDVASVKPNVSDARPLFQPRRNGSLNVVNTLLRTLILRAYGLHQSRLIGAPAWIDSTRFDVDARVDPPPPTGPDGLMPLLRTLLAERFHLRVHVEERVLPAYILTFARRDRRLGAQIVPTRADCTGNDPSSEADVRAQLLNGWPPCGMTTVLSTVDAADAMKRRVRRSGVTMDDFARELQANVDRPVVDRTGLDGRFDIEYTFIPPDATADAVANLPTLLVALEEQLGLKLEAQRTAVPVVVVDSIEKLKEN
jgi:uncharacterized protein (TIGR03435 family)